MVQVVVGAMSLDTSWSPASSVGHKEEKSDDDEFHELEVECHLCATVFIVDANHMDVSMWCQ
jgi:hypothetical protein